MKFIKFIVSPIAALSVLIFVPAVWMLLGRPGAKSLVDVNGINMITHSFKSGAIGGYLVLGIGVGALMVFLVSLIPALKLRKILILTVSSLTLGLLLYFAVIGGDPTRNREEITLARGWIGSLVSISIAFVGAFLPSQSRSEDMIDEPKIA